MAYRKKQKIGKYIVWISNLFWFDMNQTNSYRVIEQMKHGTTSVIIRSWNLLDLHI